MTSYLTATQAASRLGKSEKTIRRWIDQGRLVAHHPQGRKNLLAIAESDVEKLAQEQEQYTQPEDQASLEDRVQQLEQEVRDIRSLTDRVAALEQSLERLALQLNQGLPAIAPARPRIMRPAAAAYTVSTPVDIPRGSLPHRDFAERHGVNPNTFRDHVIKGLVPAVSRPKANRPREIERWLSPEQQRDAIAFWTRNGTHWQHCEDPQCVVCSSSSQPEDQDQRSPQETLFSED